LSPLEAAGTTVYQGVDFPKLSHGVKLVVYEFWCATEGHILGDGNFKGFQALTYCGGAHAELLCNFFTELPALKRRNKLLSLNFLLVIGNRLEISGTFFPCKSYTAPKASIIFLMVNWLLGQVASGKTNSKAN
jgi:hypothetical protein